jgi:hypothetical protein
MSKLSRAAQRGLTTNLRNTYAKAEREGDQAAMNEIYDRWVDSDMAQSRVDRVVEGAREWRGSYRVSRGKTRFTDDLS